MKGTIVKCMEELVTAKFGARKWEECLKNSGLPPERTFMVMDDVDEKEFLQLVKGIASTASLSLEQTYEAFGEHWSSVYGPNVYGAYFSGAKSVRELLLQLDQIHDVTTKSMKSARPPRFRYEWKGDKHLIMHYSSKRGMVGLMPGLVRGLGKYYKEQLTVSVEGNAVHVKFA